MIITTDMYLDRKTISQILNNIGISEYILFLSSEVGYTKQTGNMFDYVISDLHIQYSELIHIGDNERSDYKNALDKGIQAIWLQKKNAELKYWRKSKDIYADHLYSILNNKDFMIEDVEEAMGYKLIGPVLFNFCMWVNNEDRINKFDQIVFIAREGYLIYQVFKMLFPHKKDKIAYLRVNKNTLRLPVLYVNDSINTFSCLIPEKKVYSILDIIELLYIDKGKSGLSALLQKYNYSFDSIIKREEMSSNSNFNVFYRECLRMQRDEIKRQYEFLQKYFSENNVKGKVALVNNSINANAQFCLQLLKEKCFLDTEFWGIHFIISRSGMNKINARCSVWFNNKCRQFEKRLFYRNCLIFEHLLFAPEGTALYYADRDHKIEVICAERGHDEEGNDKLIEKIKKGVMEFVKDYTLRMPLYLSSSFNLAALCSFYLNPILGDARFIGSLKDDDKEKSSLSNKWYQGTRTLQNRTNFYYNAWLHMELILKKMF